MKISRPVSKENRVLFGCVLVVVLSVLGCSAHKKMPSEPVNAPACRGLGLASWVLDCSGSCPDGSPCRRRARQDDDGLFEWCGCEGEEGEPKGCHAVSFTGRGSGRPPTILCAGECPDGQRCTLEVQRGPLTPQGYRERSECVCQPIQ